MRKRVMRTKRGTVSMSLSTVVTVVLSLFVIIIIITFGIGALVDIFKTAFYGEGSVGRTVGNYFNATGFNPYRTELSKEETSVDDSMKALVRAINGAAKGESVSSLTEKKDEDAQSDVRKKIAWVRIEYWSELDLIGDVIDTNEYTQKTLSGDDVFKNINPFIYVYDSEILNQHPDYIKERKIDGFDIMHNIGIHVEYTDGTPPCDLQTEPNSNNKYSGNDLKTYVDSNPLGCASSPTYLECPYFKVYYCGKKGHIRDVETGDGSPVYHLDGHSTAYGRFYFEATRQDVSKVTYQRDGFGSVTWDHITRLNPWDDQSHIPFTTDYYTLPPGSCEGGLTIKEGLKVSCDSIHKSCMVCGFNLPQQDANEEWISAFGKPKYLVYYEQFPHGPESHWQISLTDSLLSIGTSAVIAGGLEFVGGKFIGDAVTKAGKQFGKAMGEILLTQSGESLFTRLSVGYTKEGVEVFVKRSMLRTTLFKEYTERLGIDTVEQLDNLFVQSLTEALENAPRQGLQKPLVEIQREALASYEQKLLTHLAGTEGGEALAKEIAQKTTTTMTSQVSKAALTEAAIQISYKNMLSGLVEEGTEKLSKEAIDELFEQSFKQVNEGLLKLPKVYQEQALRQAEKRASSLLTKEGEFVAYDAIGKNFDSVLDDALEAQGSKVLEFGTFMKDMGAHTKDRIAGYLPSSGWIDGPVSPLALSFKPTAQVKQLSSWMYGKRWTFLVLAAFVSENIDNMYNHYTPVGINTLGVSTPTFLGQSKTYSLSTDAEKYYIALHERYLEGDVPTRRFYLVSPCTTDLQVERGLCKCYRQKEGYHFNFGGGYIDVLPATLSFKSPTISTSDYQRIRELLSSRPSQGLLTAGIKNEPLIKNNLDYSTAVKQCVDRTAMDSLQAGYAHLVGNPNEWEEYTTECLLVKPKPYAMEDANYCYARFPATASIKKIVGIASIALTIAVPIVTGGAALPAIVPIAMAGAAIEESITQFAEKWPASHDYGEVERELPANAERLNNQ